MFRSNGVVTSRITSKWNEDENVTRRRSNKKIGEEWSYMLERCERSGHEAAALSTRWCGRMLRPEASHSTSMTKVQIDNPADCCTTNANLLEGSLSSGRTKVQMRTCRESLQAQRLSEPPQVAQTLFIQLDLQYSSILIGYSWLTFVVLR